MAHLSSHRARNAGRLQQVCAFDAPEAVNFQSGLVAVDGVHYFTLFSTPVRVQPGARMKGVPGNASTWLAKGGPARVAVYGLP